MLSAAFSRFAAERAQIATSAPSRANSSAHSRPSPLLAAATIATFPFSPSSMILAHRILGEKPPQKLSAQISVRLLNPVLARRTKNIHVHGILHRFGRVRHVRGNQQHFAVAQNSLAV